MSLTQGALTICTHNIAAAMSDDRCATSLEMLRVVGPDLIALQEMNGRQDLTAAVAGYTAFHGPDHDTGGGSPILYKSANWDDVTTAVRFTSDPGNYGPGAGPTVIGHGIATIFRGCHKPTGRWIVVINEHMVPSIYNPLRLGVWQQQCRNLAAIAWRRRNTATVFVVGDMNNVPGSRHFGPFRSRGLVNDNPRIITHPVTGRIIDLIWRLDVADPKRMTKSSVDVLSGYYSDHKPVIAHYSVTKYTPTPDGTPVPTPAEEPDEPIPPLPQPDVDEPDDDTSVSFPRRVRAGIGENGVVLPGGWVLDEDDSVVVSWDEWQEIQADQSLLVRLVDLGTTTDPVVGPPSFRDIQQAAKIATEVRHTSTFATDLPALPGNTEVLVDHPLGTKDLTCEIVYNNTGKFEPDVTFRVVNPNQVGVIVKGNQAAGAIRLILIG